MVDTEVVSDDRHDCLGAVMLAQLGDDQLFRPLLASPWLPAEELRCRLGGRTQVPVLLVEDQLLEGLLILGLAEPVGFVGREDLDYAVSPGTSRAALAARRAEATIVSW